MKILIFVVHCFFVEGFRRGLIKAGTQDQTSPRANTLFDDPDDIQKQLDNEALDRSKQGKFKTIWVFHLPTQLPGVTSRGDITRKLRQATIWIKTIQNSKALTIDGLTGFADKRAPEPNPPDESVAVPSWDYREQQKWPKDFPTCGGASQSPVDLPYAGLSKTKGARQMIFSNYNTMPKSMRLYNDGKTATVYGEWAKSEVPVIYGGAAHNRCYLFHSIIIHWPSEHSIAGLLLPLETQALFVSSIYGSKDEAISASSQDQLAFLTVATLYKYSNCSHPGTMELLQAAVQSRFGNNTLPLRPFSHYSPMFKQYAVYHGSLTQPPCTESVLWLIRARALPVTRDIIELLQRRPEYEVSLRYNMRHIQQMNDRRVYIFN